MNKTAKFIVHHYESKRFIRNNAKSREHPKLECIVNKTVNKSNRDKKHKRTTLSYRNEALST